MKIRARLGLVLLALLCEAASGKESPRITADEEPSAASESLDRHDLIRAVLDRNPSLESARQAWRAARERVPQARSLEDPRAILSIAPLSFNSAEAPMGEVVSLSQGFPYPGTLGVREEIAGALAESSAKQMEAVRLRLATAASMLYDDYWCFDRALQITREHLDLLNTFQTVAASRYATGTAPQQAPLRAEVEAAHLLHRQVALRTERRKVVARLNALLHRAAGTPLAPAPDRLDVDAFEIGEVETAAAARPEVAAQRAEIEALRARAALEELRLRPDFEVSTSYNSMWGTPEHRWTVGVGLRLPVWRKRLRASVAEAEARLAAGESELDALNDAVAAEVEMARAGLDEAAHVVRLYRDRILPAARDQVAAARAGFETGAGSMLELIDAQRSLLTAELAHVEAVAEVASTRAALDRALGRMPLGWGEGGRP